MRRHTRAHGSRQDDDRAEYEGVPANPRRTILLLQGLYFVITGVWPLVSIRTFQMVSGPKADLWLVKTVGILVGVIGVVLLMAGRRRTYAPEIALLAVGSAAGLAGVDIVYVARGRIARVYLLDALAELGFIAGWASVFLRRRGAE